MLLLRKESFFRFNRAMLLIIMLLALLLPLCNIHPLAWGTITASQPSSIDITPSAFSILLHEITVLPTGATQVIQTAQQPWWVTPLCHLYIIGMTITLLVKFTQFGLLYRHIHRGVLWTDTQDGITLYCHAHKVAPFSWFRSIVISDEDYTHNASTILQHELGHIRHHHSFDILLLNVCQVIQWANPLAWVLGNTLRDVHEYEADDAVLRSGVNIQQYQYLLIKKAVDSSSYAFANSFNHSSLKKRITMMLQKKSNPWMRTKALYLIPMALVTLSAFATPELTNPASKNADEVTNRDKVTTNSVNVQTSTTKKMAHTTLPDGDEVLDKCEEMPTYPGGTAGLIDFISTNLKYPPIAQEYQIQGRLLMQFTVQKDGTCADFKLIKSIELNKSDVKVVEASPDGTQEEGTITPKQFEAGKQALEEEAYRVVKLMDTWTPGKEKGEPVNVRFVLPLTFRLK